MTREILHYPSTAKKGLGWSSVSINDFSHEKAEVISDCDISKMKLTPYCFDFEQKCIIYATGVDPIDLVKANFYYVKQRETANGFLVLPIEKIPATIPIIKITPIIIFSPGRCGSTLLSKIIDAMGVTSISEPDFYTQVVLYVFKNKPSAAEMIQILHMLKFASYSLLQPFSAQKETNVVLKMRSQVNFSPSIIIDGLPHNNKIIFLTRDFQSYCLSRMRAFGGTIENSFENYLQSFRAFRWLQINNECMVIRYEDLLRDPLTEVAKIAKLLNASISAEALQEVLEKDSQEGTSIAKDKLVKTLTSETVKSISKFWQEKVSLILLNKIKL